MEKALEHLTPLVSAMPPITLEEMSAIRLMNRPDTKSGRFYGQDTCGHRISPYSTTYWDEPEHHRMFRNHHCGHWPRTKVRVRTYLDTHDTFLEIKKKDNHGLTRKERVAVPSLEEVIDKQAGEEFLKSISGYSFNEITPTLGNRFNRITLVNFDKTERLTIAFG